MYTYVRCGLWGLQSVCIPMVGIPIFWRIFWWIAEYLRSCFLHSVEFWVSNYCFFQGTFIKTFTSLFFFLQKNLQCPDCPKRFPMASVLKYHQEKAHQSKSQICNICGKVVLKMKNHILMIHSGEKRFRMCSSYVFTNPEFSICYCFFKKKLSSQ